MRHLLRVTCIERRVESGNHHQRHFAHQRRILQQQPKRRSERDDQRCTNGRRARARLHKGPRRTAAVGKEPQHQLLQVVELQTALAGFLAQMRPFDFNIRMSLTRCNASGSVR